MFMSVPAWVVVAGIGVEGLWRAVRRRPGGTVRAGTQFAVWAMRPWLWWGLFNLVFSWRGQNGFNNLRTFPFFANLWEETESWGQALHRIGQAPGVVVWGGAVLAVLAALVGWLAWVLWRTPRRIWPALASLYVLTVALHLSLACLPNGAWTGGGRAGSLLSAWHAHATMLYTVPFVKDSDDYLRRFREIQPQLRSTIHGLSHPPGASLSLYWIGNALGARGLDIRQPETRLRYTLGLTLFGALNVVIIFLLARGLFDARTGFLAALLWATAPSVSIYATFAQDAVYAVFFNLALLLAWHTVTAVRRPAGFALGLGATFFVLALLNYSWCILATIFAIFALWTGRRARWTPGVYALRVGLPLATMALLGGVFLAHYRLDYWAIYRFSRQYVDLWYPFTGPYQWLMALIGGQLDLLLLLGSVTCAAFVAATVNFRKLDFREPRVIYLAVLLGVFALPLLFGPNCLKMETARCWNWIATLPLAFAAAQLLRMPDRLFAVGAPVVSVLTCAGLRLFLNFAP